MSFLICAGVTLVRFLIVLLVYRCATNPVEHVHWSREANTELVQVRVSEPDSPRAAEEKPLRELIGTWCSAYSDLNPKQMADLETAGVEVVDGFGDEHHFMSRNGRERFWMRDFSVK